MGLSLTCPSCHLPRIKELYARFDGGRLSSEGGVLLLRGIERRLGIIAGLAICLTDMRDPVSTTHSYADIIWARLFAIACRYEDRGELNVLCIAPVFKLACDRLPETGHDLRSQPTLSRLENTPSRRALASMRLMLFDTLSISNPLSMFEIVFLHTSQVAFLAAVTQRDNRHVGASAVVTMT
jgi:hypothetical protein